MKNLLFSLLLPFFFLCGTVFNSYAGDQIRNGGVELHIFISKMASPMCVFSIPEKYIGENNDLKSNLEITITDTNKTTVFTTTSGILQISLPNTLSGTYYIELKIEDYFYIKKVSL